MLVKAVDQINNCCTRLLISLSAISIFNKEVWVWPCYERTHKDKDSLHSHICTHCLEIVGWTLGLDLHVAFLLQIHVIILNTFSRIHCAYFSRSSCVPMMTLTYFNPSVNVAEMITELCLLTCACLCVLRPSVPLPLKRLTLAHVWRCCFHGDLIAHRPPVFIQSNAWFQELAQIQISKPQTCCKGLLISSGDVWICCDIEFVYAWFMLWETQHGIRRICVFMWARMRWCWQLMSFSLNFAVCHFL